MIFILLIMIWIGLLGYVNYQILKNGVEPESPVFINALIITFGGFVTSFIFGLACAIGSSFSVVKIEKSRDSYSCPIYSLTNKQGLTGSFVLGSGSINDTEYYYSFTKNQRGGYERIKLNVNHCILYQDAESARMEWQEIHYRFNKWFAPEGVNFLLRSVKTKYDIFVPPNTIIEKYNVQ